MTGACLSADERLLGLVGHRGAFVFQLEGDLTKLGLVEPHQVRFANHRIEGCCFQADGLLATSESREVWLFTDAAFVARK